jgi:hypothetical protein
MCQNIRELGFCCQAAGAKKKNPSVSAEVGTHTDARFMAELGHRDLEL